MVQATLRPSKSPLLTPQRRATKALQEFANELQRLHHAIDLNNIALEPKMFSDGAEFLETADQLFKRLQFLVGLHLPKNAGFDFICDSPVEIVERMYAKAEVFRRLYPESWDKSLIFSQSKTSAELAEAYDIAKHPRLPLHLEPEQYDWRQNRNPLVPDLEHMRRVKTVGIPVGTIIHVADSF